MGFKNICKYIGHNSRKTVVLKQLVENFHISSIAIDQQYLAYLVEKIMMMLQNADTITDKVNTALVRAQVEAVVFDENSVPLTNKEKSLQKEVDNTVC